MGGPSLRTYVDGRLFDSNRGSRRMDRRVDLTRERKRSVYGDSRLRFQSRDESSARFSCRCSQALCSGMCFSQNVLWQYSHSTFRGDSVPHSAHLIIASWAPWSCTTLASFKRVLGLAVVSGCCPILVLAV